MTTENSGIQQQAFASISLLNQREAYFEAIERAKNALLDSPRNHVFLCLLGQAYTGIGNYQLAKSSLIQALELVPDCIEALMFSATLHKDFGEFKQAITCYKNVLALNKNADYAERQMGACLVKLGDYLQAVEAFRRCLSLNPNNADALYSLGLLHKLSNEQDQAIVEFEKALAIKPHLSHVYYALCTTSKVQAGDPLIDRVQTLLQAENLPNKDEACLRFSLAKMYRDIDESDLCINEIMRANKLKEQDVSYSVSAEEQRFSLIKKNLPSQDNSNVLVKSKNSVNMKRVIFVLGMPRSGTSLTEQILASHSDVYGAGEINYLSNAIGQLETSVSDIAELCSPENLTLLRESYWEKVNQHSFSSNVVVDKNTLNFKWIGLILATFPDAKIVNCKRDPLAVGWSVYSHFFGGTNFDFCWKQEHIGHYIRLYLDMMDFWRSRYPNRIYDLDYQALTQEPEQETRKLLDYCELDWQAQCLESHKLDRLVFTESNQQVRQPIYQGSNHAWKKYQSHLLPLAEILKNKAFGAST